MRKVIMKMCIRDRYKTVRKYFGEAIVVTQEVDDIISSPVVRESIINNSDCKILLDQRKYMNKFDAIQSLLGPVSYTHLRTGKRSGWHQRSHLYGEFVFRPRHEINLRHRRGSRARCV